MKAGSDKRILPGRIAAAFLAVAAVSGLVEIFGLYDTVYFNKGVISAAVFLLYVMMAGKCAGNFKDDRRTAVLAFLVSVLLAFTEILGTGLRLLYQGGEVLLTPASVLRMAGSAVVLSLAGEPFFFWLFHLTGTALGRERTKREWNGIFLKVWLITWVGYLPCFLAFYPGLYCYDMNWQWMMYATGEYSTHHPLIHTLFGGGVLELGNRLFGSYQAGLAIHSLIQLTVLSGSAAFAVRYLVKIRVSRVVWLLTAAFYLLFPFFPVLGISTTKDTIFGCLFLIVFVCVCDMVSEKRVYRGGEGRALSCGFNLDGTFPQ